MESSDGLLGIDDERWAEFAALVERVPEDRREEPSLNADGWSVKDLLWHMRCWNTVIAEQLEAIAAGTFVGPLTGHGREPNGSWPRAPTSTPQPHG